MNTLLQRRAKCMGMLPTILVCCLLVWGSVYAHAQAKIGGNPQSISSSALLELESTNRGFLPPRIALNSLTDVVTIASPSEGLLVYNNGNGLLKEKGYYYWNGFTWTSIGGFSSTSSGDMRVGETRAAVIPVDAALFPLGGLSPVFNTWMNGREANQTVQGNYIMYSAIANINDYIVFDGLRMDFASGGYGGAYRAPKLVNTTNENKLLSLTAQSTGDRQVNLGYMVIAPGAVCWYLDGNDGFAVSENDFIDYIDAVIYVHDTATGAVRMYRASWSMSHVNDGNGRNRIIAGFTVTRHS